MFPACLAVVTAIYATHSAMRSPPLEGAIEPVSVAITTRDANGVPETITVTGDLSEETFADAVIQIEDS